MAECEQWINVTDVNDPPVVSTSAFSVKENVPIGTVVGQLGSVDPEQKFQQDQGGPVTVVIWWVLSITFLLCFICRTNFSVSPGIRNMTWAAK